MDIRLTRIALIFVVLSCGGETDSELPSPSVTLPVETHCLQFASEKACCAQKRCEWIPAQSGVPEQCVDQRDHCLFPEFACPSGAICIRRDFKVAPCDDNYWKETGHAYFCHDRCPPDGQWQGERCYQPDSSLLEGAHP